jgi:hypothetical protein
VRIWGGDPLSGIVIRLSLYLQCKASLPRLFRRPDSIGTPQYGERGMPCGHAPQYGYCSMYRDTERPLVISKIFYSICRSMACMSASGVEIDLILNLSDSNFNRNIRLSNII